MFKVLLRVFEAGMISAWKPNW